MTHAEFVQARNFMFTDIRREIALANASDIKKGQKALTNLGISQAVGYEKRHLVMQAWGIDK